MRLVHDLLDNQVLDRHGARLGKVDGVILALAGDGPPRVVAIELGASVVARRVHPRLARLLAAAVRRWRVPLGRTRVPWTNVLGVGADVRVAVDGGRARVQALERWLRTRVVGRIPGSGR